MHMRKQIKNKLIEKLNEITEIKKISFDDSEILSDGIFPCLIMNTENEEIEYANLRGGSYRLQTRYLTVNATLLIKKTKNIINELENFTILIENKIGQNYKLDNLVIDTVLTNFTIETSIDSNKNIGRLSYTIFITYKCNESDVTKNQ